jgi:excisionase family DNA binding protein
MRTMNNMNTQNSVLTDTALSLQDAADYLGVSKAFLWGVCKEKRITHTRMGNRIRISMLDLDLYRAEHTVERVAQ